MRLKNYLDFILPLIDTHSLEQIADELEEKCGIVTDSHTIGEFLRRNNIIKKRVPSKIHNFSPMKVGKKSNVYKIHTAPKLTVKCW